MVRDNCFAKCKTFSCLWRTLMALWRIFLTIQNIYVNSNLSYYTFKVVQQFSPKHLLSCFVPYMMATIHRMGTGTFELLIEKTLYRIVFLFLKQYYHICKLLQQSKFRSRQFWIMWYRCNATISFNRFCINSTIYLRCNKILLLLLCLYHP